MQNEWFTVSVVCLRLDGTVANNVHSDLLVFLSMVGEKHPDLQVSMSSFRKYLSQMQALLFTKHHRVLVPLFLCSTITLIPSHHPSFLTLSTRSDFIQNMPIPYLVCSSHNLSHRNRFRAFLNYLRRSYQEDNNFMV